LLLVGVGLVALAAAVAEGAKRLAERAVTRRLTAKGASGSLLQAAMNRSVRERKKAEAEAREE
jgi:hypothetical protein